MTRSPAVPPDTEPTGPLDQDLVDQAQSDHGVPSQDPAAAAQFPLDPDEARREGHSVLVGGGLMAGIAAGAAVGAVAAGPVGVLVGGSLGAVVGALGAAAAGSTVNPGYPPDVSAAPVDTARVQGEDSAARQEADRKRK